MRRSTRLKPQPCLQSSSVPRVIADRVNAAHTPHIHVRRGGSAKEGLGDRRVAQGSRLVASLYLSGYMPF